MLLAFAVGFLVIAIISSIAVSFANGMSDAPGDAPISQKLSVFFLAVSVVLFAVWYF